MNTGGCESLHSSSADTGCGDSHVYPLPAGFTCVRLGCEDEAEVYALEQQVFSEDPWTRSMVAEELASPARHWSGVRAGERLVAWAGITVGIEADIMTIGVLPEFRGRGIGSFLLADLVDAAQKAGSERIFLEVRASNETAQRLYTSAGFDPIGRVKAYFRNPVEDAVTMRLIVSEGM